MAAIPRQSIPEGAVPVSDGMQLFKGELGFAPGFARFHPTQTLSGTAIMGIDEFPLEGGQSYLLVFTDDKAYRYDGTDFVNFTRQVAAVDVNYTGGLDDPFQGDTIVNPSGDLYFVVTNNKRDPVHKWDGNTANKLSKLGGSPFDSGDHFSRSVAGYQNHLFHLNRTEAGTAKPRLLRWSNNGLPEDYTNGSASFLTLFQGADHGVLVTPIGAYLAAYRERSIHLVSFIGSPFWFAQRQVVSGIGLRAQGALLNLDTRHVMFGNDNIYMFNGVDIEPIGDEIRDALFDNLDPDNSERSVILLDENRNTMALVVPASGSVTPDTWWFWNLTTGAWSGPVKNRPLTAAGGFERRATRTWDNAVGSWDAQSGIWDSAANVIGFPTSLFGNTTMRVYEVDPTLVTADGTSVTARMETASRYPGKELFKPERIDAVCTELQPLQAPIGLANVNWYVGTSDNPTGPFTFQGPFTRGVRGIVKTKPIRGKWFVFAAEAQVDFRLSGLIARFSEA